MRQLSTSVYARHQDLAEHYIMQRLNLSLGLTIKRPCYIYIAALSLILSRISQLKTRSKMLAMDLNMENPLVPVRKVQGS